MRFYFFLKPCVTSVLTVDKSQNVGYDRAKRGEDIPFIDLNEGDAAI